MKLLYIGFKSRIEQINDNSNDNFSDSGYVI